MRRITLCADDYGISPAVNRGIRDLIPARRINATSVMVVAPSFGQGEADALLAIADNAQIGLHVTLTAPFRPLTAGFGPTRSGAFLPLPTVLARASARRLDTTALRAEIGAQLDAFAGYFGRPPDYVDGHQHVQLFPQIRDAFLRAVAQHAPKAWVRQCGRATRHRHRFADRKALLLDVLSVAFRRKAQRLGLTFNPAFAGTYSFDPATDFAMLFPSFLDGLSDDGLIMCHPGYVDAELRRLDPLTTLREREHDYLRSDDFVRLLAARSVSLG
jgi:predicted glycoside hydrolase/deacetylase ChbG (UPF0249 family)